jgi:hypothetical protein
MAVIFARIELRGTPSEEIYERLHAYMRNLNWYQHLPDLPDRPMPKAMYQASFTNAPNLLAMASSFKSEIESTIWTRAWVLLIEKASWAQSAG